MDFGIFIWKTKTNQWNHATSNTGCNYRWHVVSITCISKVNCIYLQYQFCYHYDLCLSPQCPHTSCWHMCLFLPQHSNTSMLGVLWKTSPEETPTSNSLLSPLWLRLLWCLWHQSNCSHWGDSITCVLLRSWKLYYLSAKNDYVFIMHLQETLSSSKLLTQGSTTLYSRCDNSSYFGTVKKACAKLQRLYP